MLTLAEIDDLRNAVKFRQRRTEGPTVALTFTGGPLDGLVVDVDAHSAGHPIIGWATVTPTGCVLAEYQGDPAKTTRAFHRFYKPGGDAKPYRWPLGPSRR